MIYNIHNSVAFTRLCNLCSDWCIFDSLLSYTSPDQLNTADSSVLLHKFWCDTGLAHLPKVTDQVVMKILTDVFRGQDRQSPAVKANVSGPTPS